MIKHKASFHFSITIPMGVTGLACLQVGPVIIQVWDRIFKPQTDWSPLALCVVAGPLTLTYNRKWHILAKT